MADERDPMVRKTISLPAAIGEKGEDNAKRRGFSTSFSAYVAWLIQRDEEGAVEREQLKPKPEKGE